MTAVTIDISCGGQAGGARGRYRAEVLDYIRRTSLARILR